MSQTTKTFESRVRSIGLATDGDSLTVAVAWHEQPYNPLQAPLIVQLQIKRGRIYRGLNDLGEAPSEIATLAKNLAALATSVADELASKKLLDP